MACIFLTYVFIFYCIWMQKNKWYPFSNIPPPLQTLKPTGAYYWASPNIYLWFSAVIYTKKLGMWRRNTYFFLENKSIQMFYLPFQIWFLHQFYKWENWGLKKEEKKNIYIHTYIWRKWLKLHPRQVVVKRQH